MRPHILQVSELRCACPTAVKTVSFTAEKALAAFGFFALKDHSKKELDLVKTSVKSLVVADAPFIPWWAPNPV